MQFSQPIAIVGLGGIFPGAMELTGFWNQIANGINASREVPADRWVLSVADAHAPENDQPDRVVSTRACLIEDFAITDALDLAPLGIDRSYLERLDPLFHVTLAAGVAAFKDAVTDGLDRRRAGVILGSIVLPTDKTSALSWELLGRRIEEQVLGKTGTTAPFEIEPANCHVSGLPAGLLARVLGLGGGSYTVDAACASSLYAIALAADELLSGRADFMLSGGVSRADCLYTQMGFTALQALSPDGICSPFDAKANGLVVGEGAGIFVLKRLEDAQHAGDTIYAVIQGIGLSNDVGGQLLAPSSEGQLRAMRAAYQQVGWSPSDVDLIECHGTGTPVGDAVEFESIERLWTSIDASRGQCVIGSVKSNVGHLLTGAGAAGLMKVLLALREETLPPTANFATPAPNIPLEGSPFRILTQVEPWRRRTLGTPRRAAVSAFGFGGINAHLLLEEWLPPPPSTARRSATPPSPRPDGSIAVIGMAAHFGPWTNLSSFRERVLGGGATVEPVPKRNWFGVDEAIWFEQQWPDGVPFVGFGIDEISIPLGQFRIPPKELEEMLPQQLLMLKVAAAALDDAGSSRAGNETRDDHLRSGCFVGIGLDLNTTNFHVRWAVSNIARAWAAVHPSNPDQEETRQWTRAIRDAVGPPLNANRTIGNLGSIVASRIAREFRFGGPSYTVSSVESSGLKAMEAAVRHLQGKQIDLAVVGAVDLAADIRVLLATHRVRPYSASGTLRPFDEQADGAVFGEGAAAVVLKRLEDAEQDGDLIYALIKGMGGATGGTPNDLMPDMDAYQAALTRAYRNAGLEPDSVSYLDSQGSGHPPEDGMEAKAVTTFFGQDRSPSHRKAPLVLGSVKADIGHTGAAGGLASLVKVCLCLHHEILPPLRNLNRPRQELLDQKSLFDLPRHGRYWLRDRADGPRRAGVSAFGADGNCMHVVLEAYAGGNGRHSIAFSTKPAFSMNEAIFTVEGHTLPDLLENMGHLRSQAEEFSRSLRSAGSIEPLARRWYQGHPSPGEHIQVVVFVSRSPEELLHQIDRAAESLRQDPAVPIRGNPTCLPPGLDVDRVFYSPCPLGREGKIALVFPGSGNHHAGMGREIGLFWPSILHRQDAENGYLRSQMHPEVFWDPDRRLDSFQDQKVLLLGQVTLGTLVSDLLRSFHVNPDAVIGYSLGESAGLFALRAWRDRDGIMRRLNRSTLFTTDLAGPCRAAQKAWKLPESSTVEWSIGVLNAPAEQVKKALDGRTQVYLLIVNTPRQCVVGGEAKAVAALVEDLGYQFLPLKGVTTAHCEVVKEVATAYRDFHLQPTAAPPGVVFYSGAWGKAYELTAENAADSVLAHALHGLDFPKVIEAAYEDGVRIFVEAGPGASCSRMIGSILGRRPHLARSACYPGDSEISSVMRLLGHLIAEGVPVVLGGLFAEETKTGDIANLDSQSTQRIAHQASRALTVPVGGKPIRVPAFDRLEVSPVAALPVHGTVESSKWSDIQAEAVRSAIVPTEERKDDERSIVADQSTGWLGLACSVAPLMRLVESVQIANTKAHEAYLRLSRHVAECLSENVAARFALTGRGGLTSIDARVPEGVQAHPSHPFQTESIASPSSASPPTRTPALDRAACMEFAVGSISKVLGNAYAEIDRHPTRVRLPDEPLMLVDRILTIEGEPLSLTSGRVVTEHDVLERAWYLDGGRIPTGLAVEAGQADLFLSGYLGIDLRTKGLAVYRLLDAIVTFHHPLPLAGDIIRYDIRIDSFFQQAGTYLFRWNFESSVGGEPLMTMTDGCTGFFTPSELAAGQGIVQTRLDRQSMSRTRPPDWTTLVPLAVESYSEQQLDALRAGDLVGCFGPGFGDLGIERPLTLPSGRLRLIQRVLHLDPEGGRFGLGGICAQMDIHPDDWFLVHHFKDDHVMPGTLMFECCLHTLRILLMRMGWIAPDDGPVWEPVPGVSSRLKCRGQVVERTRKATYEISVKELGYRPQPYAIADAVMVADGKPIVAVTDMSAQLSGMNREAMIAIWARKKTSIEPIPRHDVEDRPPLFAKDRILAFAVGNPSEAFGEPYKVFDEDRVIARLPGPPYDFMDAVTPLDTPPWKMVPGGVAEAVYEVPEDAWFFASNRHRVMPFAVLLEIALQPCGWLAAYLGSALTSEIDLSFRNLGGAAVQYMPVTPDTGRLNTTVHITKVSSSGGMIIQHFDFDVRCEDRHVYRGNTYFGFFSKAALAQQIGIRDATFDEPTESETARGRQLDFPMDPPFPGRQLRMIDRIDLYVPDGGPSGLGLLRGSLDVDPQAWFFKAHFYQDPVIPGSLGLESLLQLLKYAAYQRWGLDRDDVLLAMAPAMRHEWMYRGQVIPADRQVTVTAWITSVDDTHRVLFGDGYLSVDGRTIYRMSDFSLRIWGDKT